MEPKYSEEKPLMSTRLGSGGRVSSGGTKRQSECPIVSSSTSSSDEETTTTTDYYSYTSALSPGTESVATNASDTSLSLRVDEITNYRPLCSERSTSAHSQRSSTSSASSRHRKKRVTDSGCVVGGNDSRPGSTRSARDQGEQTSTTCNAQPSHRAERQLRSETSFLDVSSGVAGACIPVVSTVTVSGDDAEKTEDALATVRRLDVQPPKGTRLLRGRAQKLAERKPEKGDTLAPVRVRPFPKSFYQQPNRPSPIPPGLSAFPLLPPLGDEQLTGADDASPKTQRRSTVFVGNLDLLQRLFDRVEAKDRERERDRKARLPAAYAPPTALQTTPASYQRKSRSNSLPRAPAACSKLLNADPFLLENVTERLFPELSLDQQDSLNSSLNSSKTLTLPSLGDINYPQMLSELVTQI